MIVEKNMYVPYLSYEELSYDNVLKILSEGHEIIFVVKNNKMDGCITVGDIKRMLDNNNENNIPLNQLINKNCKRIIYQNDEQAIDEAQEIFSKHTNIHNIPVIDANENICFQYEKKDDEKQHKIYNLLYELDDITAIDNFLKWHENKNIILVGYDKEILNLISEFFKNKILDLEIQTNFRICTTKNFFTENNNDLIICIDNATKLYLLLMKKQFSSLIIHLEEIRRYYMSMFTDIDKLLKVNQNDIKDWINLFEYDTIFFNSSNCYTSYLKSLMEKCNIKVYENTLKLPDKDIVMTSNNETYLDSINVSSLSFIFEIINAYRYIMGRSISKKEYIHYALLVLQKNKLIYKYKHLNPLDKEIYDESKKITEVYGNKYMSENIYRDIIMVSLIEDNVIKKIRIFTTRLYIHKTINDNKFEFLPNRHLLLAISKKRNRYFEPEFIREFYGDEYRNVDKILDNLSGRTVVQFHSCYSKFLSNYNTEYVSTNMYGDLVVTDTPEKYYGTIYLIGPCLYWGTTVPNKYTMASYLQKKLNINGKSYKVISFSGVNGLWRRYGKVIENKLQPQDIVIVMPIEYSVLTYNDNLIYTDWENLDKKIPFKNWYWDKPIHCNYYANEIIANEIYEKIEKDLTENYFPKFQLDCKLEKEIFLYLQNIKIQLEKSSLYQNFICQNRKEIGKIGSIVMNCNPFTLGHLYLIETASRLVDLLYIFVVEEDKSEFTFQKRFLMVKNGTSHLSNVMVFPSGKVMISTDTFGGYFSKNKPQANCYDSFLDLKIFAHYIAPELNISIRFVGDEPFDKITAQYNKDMKAILGNEQITVIEIPRKKADNAPISATIVRKFLKEKKWDMIDKLVPESTKLILMQKDN